MGISSLNLAATSYIVLLDKRANLGWNFCSQLEGRAVEPRVGLFRLSVLTIVLDKIYAAIIHSTLCGPSCKHSMYSMRHALYMDDAIRSSLSVIV